MKLEKKYIVLIAVIIILIFLFGFSYFSKSSLSLPVTTINDQNQVTNENTQATQPKNFSFAYASCSISGGSDIIKFKIQTGEKSIGRGTMLVELDMAVNTGFKNSNGDTLNSVPLSANSVSDEFSYTAPNHLEIRKITVDAPIGEINQLVTCS